VAAGTFRHEAPGKKKFQHTVLRQNVPWFFYASRFCGGFGCELADFFAAIENAVLRSRCDVTFRAQM
jgi:hypothetical protein